MRRAAISSPGKQRVLPSALIIGMSNSLTHELNVRESFLAYAPSNWGADILMRTEDLTLGNNNHVVGVIEGSVSSVGYNDLDEFVSWVRSRTDYDLIIMSYSMGNEATVMEYIVTNEDRILCMPTLSTGYHSNITATSPGATEAVTAGNTRIECYYEATALKESWQLTASYVNAAIAGKMAQLKETGLTNTQVRQALRANLDTVWSATNGYGKLPDTLTVPEAFGIEPVNKFNLFDGGNINSAYTLFSGVEIDSIRIYMDDDVLLYDGNGVKTTNPANLSSYYDSRVRYTVTYDDFTYNFTQSDEGEHTFHAVTVKDGVESTAPLYAFDTQTLTQVILENYFGVVYEL